MSNCTPAPPCDTEFPLFCEGLETTTDGRKIVVEDNASCQKVLLEPTEVSVLQYDANNDVAWKSGSLTSPIKLPSLQLNAVNVAPKIMVLQADGTVRQWQPTDTGDNFLAYWDGTQWKIGNLASLLPAGNGVLVKTGSSFSLANGVNGDFLQVLSGSIQFNSTIPGGIPTGTVVPFASTTTPSGWILCDGGLYGRTSGDPSPQPNLFSVIGTTYGAGDSLTTFAVPDLRGMFVRGFDDGRGIDPLRAFGSQQADALKSHNHGGTTGNGTAHTHSYSGATATETQDHFHYAVAGVTGSPERWDTININASEYIAARAESTGTPDWSYTLNGVSTVATRGRTSNESSTHNHTFSGTTGTGSSHTHTISDFGGTETRPINVAMNYIIKT
jgi:microcystin-dependent protein